MPEIPFQYKVILHDVMFHKSHYELPLIGLFDTETGLMICLTDYTDYLYYRQERDTVGLPKNRSKAYAVTDLLNYILFEKYDKYQVSGPLDITKDMARDYLRHYARTPYKNGRYPSQTTLNDRRCAICQFLWNLHQRHDSSNGISAEDFMFFETVINENRSPVQVPHYRIYYEAVERTTGLDSLIRDMPYPIIARFIDMADKYDKELTFAIVLSAYAGLREGAVCSVRRRERADDPGILLETIGNRCTAFSVRLDDESSLRSDNVRQGDIKKHRTQETYPGYTDILYKYYLRHLSYIKDKPCEATLPLFLNKYAKKGVYMAMTDSNYAKRIQHLFRKHVLPSLRDDPDPEMQRFYWLMAGHTWGAHAFRHWFTVSLVLLGQDENQIAHYRGDSNITSAQTYMQNKGRIFDKYKKYSSFIADAVSAADTHTPDVNRDNVKIIKGGLKANE